MDAALWNQIEAGGDRADNRARGVAGHSSPSWLPSVLLLKVEALMTSGSVAPISDVGTISTTNAIARCTPRGRPANGRSTDTRPRTPAAAGEHRRRDERRGANQQLGRTEPSKWIPDAVGHEARGAAAEGQAGHEHRPHGAGGVDGDAEHPPERPEPQHLVDEGAGAGTEEQQTKRREEEPGAARRGRHRHILLAGYRLLYCPPEGRRLERGGRHAPRALRFRGSSSSRFWPFRWARTCSRRDVSCGHRCFSARNGSRRQPEESIPSRRSPSATPISSSSCTAQRARKYK